MGKNDKYTPCGGPRMGMSLRLGKVYNVYIRVGGGNTYIKDPGAIND